VTAEVGIAVILALAMLVALWGFEWTALQLQRISVERDRLWHDVNHLREALGLPRLPEP
jgi:hypothetical protein